jgi:hypothetical protein
MAHPSVYFIAECSWVGVNLEDLSALRRRVETCVPCEPILESDGTAWPGVKPWGFTQARHEAAEQAIGIAAVRRF